MRGPFGVGNIVPVRIPELAAGVFSFLSLSPRGIFPDRKTPNGAVPTKIPELQRELPCLTVTLMCTWIFLGCFYACVILILLLLIYFSIFSHILNLELNLKFIIVEKLR